MKEDIGMNIARNEVVTQIDASYDQKADDTLQAQSGFHK